MCLEWNSCVTKKRNHSSFKKKKTSKKTTSLSWALWFPDEMDHMTNVAYYFRVLSMVEEKLILFWHDLPEVWQHSLLSNPQWYETHTFLFVSLWAGIQIPHAPHMNIHTFPLCFPFFLSAPRDCKNIRLAVEGARDGECVKGRMLGKESTDFNSQNSSGRPQGMEGWGEREEGREGRKDVSRYYDHCHEQAWGAIPVPRPLSPSFHINAHSGSHRHTLCNAS